MLNIQQALPRAINQQLLPDMVWICHQAAMAALPTQAIQLVDPHIHSTTTPQNRKEATSVLPSVMLEEASFL